MKIIVKAKPSSKQEKIERVGQEGLPFPEEMLAQRSLGEVGVTYKVWVRELAVDGRANEAIIKVIAKYFDVPKSKVKIIKGEMTKQKIIAIL